MTSVQKRLFGLLLFMAAVAFVLFALPNAVASQNMSMVQVFQPDEAAPLPYVFQMIAHAPSLNQALRPRGWRQKQTQKQKPKAKTKSNHGDPCDTGLIFLHGSED